MLSKHGQPMVGFPDHVKDEYSKKLSDAGYSVLIEQAFELNPPKREPEKLQTLQQVVDTYFGTDCESAETEHGTWKLATADGDKVGELFYGGAEEHPWTDALVGFNHLCFQVDDINTSVQKIRDAGYPVDVEPRHGADHNWQAWVTDPNGIRIELMQIMPGSPQSRFG